MSIKVMTYIWESSHHKGSALLLLLAIGDHAHDDGTGAYPSVETLAAKIRMSIRNTQRLIRDLIASGELIVEAGGGPRGANLYSIPLTSLRRVTTCHPDTQEQGGDSQGTAGVTTASLGGDTAMSPKSSENHQRTIKRENHEAVEVDEPFRGRMRIKYRGVLTEIDERIDQALAHSQASKYWNKQLYVQGWLRRDAEQRNGGSNGQSSSNAQGDRRPREIYTIPEDTDGKPILGSRPATMLPVR